MGAVLTTPVLAFLCVALPALALIFGLPSHPAILAVLNDAAHGPLFAMFAVVVTLILRRRVRWPGRWQLLAAFVAAVLAGGMVELIQPAMHRSGGLADLWTDAMGALGGLAVLTLVSSHRRLVPIVTLAVAICAIGWPVVEAALAYEERSRQAPALLELSGHADWYFLWTRGMEASAARLPDPWNLAHDPASVRVLLTTDPERTFGHSEPFRDWRGHRRLLVDLTNPGREPLWLTLRVHDGFHDDAVTDRFNRRFVLEAATRSVLAIPLTEIARAPHGRTLDLSDVAAWMIFVRDDPSLAGREFYLTRVWLE